MNNRYTHYKGNGYVTEGIALPLSQTLKDRIANENVPYKEFMVYDATLSDATLVTAKVYSFNGCYYVEREQPYIIYYEADADISDMCWIREAEEFLVDTVCLDNGTFVPRFQIYNNN